MNEDHTFDDERLLVYALGLEDDAELAAAAASDEVLAGRLATMRADVGAVAAGLDRVVPAPFDAYTDLGDARWDDLRRLVAAPATAAPRRRPVWLRVLVPVAVVAVVLAAGVAGLRTLDLGGGEATVSTADRATESYDREDAVGQGAAVPGAYDDRGGPSPTAAWDASGFGTIVVATAETTADGRQRFEVVRVLRGEADPRLSLRVGDKALPEGTLAVLFLEPAADEAGGTTLPAPAVSGTAAARTEGEAIRYTFKGMPAWAVQLPATVDPADVSLP
jgi:hypothetical protein